MQESQPTSALPRPPRRKLVLHSYLWLMAAFLTGSLVATPFLFSRVRSYHEMTVLVDGHPSKDAALKAWALTQPGVIAFETKRHDNELFIRSEYRGLARQPPLDAMFQQMRSLGYTMQGMKGGAMAMLSDARELLTDSQTLAVMLATTQLALGGLGWFGLARARRRNEPLPPLLGGKSKRAMIAGVVGGLALLAFGWVYSTALHWLFGHAPPSSWDAVNSMPAATRLLLVLFGTVGAPLAEELFFRGFLFGRFKAAGYLWLGVLVSSVLFGVIHFSDPYNVPGICAYGALLAWLFHRYDSLLAPIAAHAANNGVAIVSMMLV